MPPLRTMEYDAQSSTYIVRDSQSDIKAILHMQQPFVVSGESPRAAAESYVRRRQSQVAHDGTQLHNLHIPPALEPDDSGLEYRFLSEKRQADTTTVTFQLAQSGLAVWQAALSVHLKDMIGDPGEPGRFEVICAQKTGDVPPPPRPQVAAAARSVAFLGPQPVTEESLARQLGITDPAVPFEPASLRIQHRRAMVYRFDAANRDPVTRKGLEEDEHVVSPSLPPVPDEISDGRHYTVEAIYFELAATNHAPLDWLALVETDTHSVLFLDVLTGGINGLVFVADPITTRGGPPPRGSPDDLNACRSPAALRELDAPNPTQRLVGRNVCVTDLESPRNRVPDMPPGEDFQFDVRTDEFAAVNAYFHCDRLFRLIEDLGFDRDRYFPGTTFPIQVDARGTPTSGMPLPNVVNAQCRMIPVSGPDGVMIGGIKRTIFCLADLNAAIGNATDWRVVLHELGGHGILFGHVGASRMGFSHTAGDSLAAILNDPESKAADRYLTFPWTQISPPRRHDRDAAHGWAWDGEKDLNDSLEGLHREQILSSTHFRIYESLGGRSPDSDVRHRAARLTIYLILRAVQTLTPATNPQHASDWLCSLLVADAADWPREGYSGGAYGKVITWAFQQQGLFGGAPPDVDVYIDDGRGGAYDYQQDHTRCPGIWNRHRDDGMTAHEDPIPDVVNFAYVKIKNRGAQAATSVMVSAFQDKPDGTLTYPDGWQPMTTAELTVNDLAAQSAEVTVGPFEWIPSSRANAILMAVSAAGDASHLSKFGSGKSIPDWRLVPHDNNLGLRKV